MNNIILGSISVILIIMVSLYIYKRDCAYKRFLLLKPGDKVYITIQSLQCSCDKEATVHQHKGKYVVAFMSESEKNICRDCSRNTPNIDCWYHVTYFDKESIRPI